MLKNKTYIISALLLCSFSLFSQVNTNSPYSRFGLGELTMQGLTQNLSLGGSGIGIRSNTLINYLNPAAYSAIDTMSFLFDFGVDGSLTKYSTNLAESKGNNFNIHHIAVGFGISKNWKASVGIVPYSSVGYNISESDFVSGAGILTYNYKGSGGLNRFYMGTSLMLFQHISLGVNLSYLFGYLNYANSVVFPSGIYAGPTLVENRLNLGDMTYNLGFQYHETIQDKYFFTLGAVFDNETNIKTNYSVVQTTAYPGSKVNLGDTLIIDPTFVVNTENHSGQTLLPRNMGAGISFGIKGKLMVAGDYRTQEWSKAIIPGKNDTLVNSGTMSFGIEFTPNEQAIQGYFNRIHYRLGGYNSNNYLRIRNEQLKDYGISFGVGLPFRGTKSSFNVGFIAGKRGTLNNNLIKENYSIVNFGLTLHDFWFFKRKFD